VKVKLKVELECNGGMQYKVLKQMLVSISAYIHDSVSYSEHSSEKNIITNEVTDSGFDEVMKEKDAAIFLDMSYKTLRDLRQRKLAPVSHKEGRSFMYKSKDLEPYSGMCQFKIRHLWESCSEN